MMVFVPRKDALPGASSHPSEDHASSAETVLVPAVATEAMTMAARGLIMARQMNVPRSGYSLGEVARSGCISGDFQMRTVASLQRKGLFCHHIDSPNGQWGPMRLTPLGEVVRAAMKARP